MRERASSIKKTRPPTIRAPYADSIAACQSRQRSRQWRIPPALLHDGAEHLDGGKLLREHTPARAMVLWQTARSVMLWGEASEPEALFAADAHERTTASLRRARFDDSGVESWMAQLVEHVFKDPESEDRERVSELCVRISRWAVGRDALGTALIFAQAAAIANPTAPRPAFETALAATAVGQHARADSWLQRAVALARRQRDWETYALAYVELGRLANLRGDRHAARAGYIRANRAARRNGLAHVRSEARHGMMRVAMEESPPDLLAARRYGTAALRLSDRRAKPPALLHDFSELLLREAESEADSAKRRSLVRRADGMLRKLLPDVQDPERRMYTLALLATASALRGAIGLLAERWTDAWMLTTAHPGAALRRRALAELARAARLSGDARRAAQADAAAKG